MSFFSPESSNSGSSLMDLIPAGTLVKAVLIVRDIKHSQQTGGRYLDIELAVQGGQFDNRRVFTVICDPWDENTSEKAREMAIGSITRLMEQVGVFDPSNPSSYSGLDNASVQDVAIRLQSKTVCFAVGVQKGKEGYADKNSVKDWSSPNPASHGYKIHEAIAAGLTTLPKAPQTSAAFAAAPAAQRPAQAVQVQVVPAASTPAWLKK